MLQKELNRIGPMCMGEVMELSTEDLPIQEWKETAHEEEIELEAVAINSVTGEPLDSKLMMEAQTLEIKYVCEMKLSHKVPRSDCINAERKPIATRWIDVNNGDTEDKNYSSRLVARRIKKNVRPDLFAATPPLEALRLLMSDVATLEAGRERKMPMKNDVS